MTDLLIQSGTLIASADERTVSGLLVPFGEEGRTNLGRFTVAAGALTIPRDPQSVTLNLDHDREQPIARATVLAEEADGIHATFRFFETEEGDAALDEFRTGKRQRLSVEAKNMVLRAGKAISGRIFGAAQLAAGAFPSATLMAADVGDLPAESDKPVTTSDVSTNEYTDEDGKVWKRTTTRTTTTENVDGVVTTTITEKHELEEPEPITNQEEESTVTLPNTLDASSTSTKPKSLSVSEIGTALYAVREGTLSAEDFADLVKGQNGNSLFAALSDVKFDGTGGIGAGVGLLPQWIGEVWNALTYRQQVLPLFNHADLTSMTINGFRWATKPSGGDWAGNKTDVPSNTLTVQAVTEAAGRYAIGHDIAREFQDFNVPGFFESYAAAVTEDYAKWADAKVTAKVIAGATALAGDALTTLPGATGGTIGSAASAIIDGATVLVTNGSLPDFALVAPVLWKQMAKQPKANVLGYLNAALGLDEGDLGSFVIRPSASVPAGKVLVGAKQAATVYELPGAPIRIDALDLARGGIDKAAFGYLGTVVNDARGLQLVTAATS